MFCQGYLTGRQEENGKIGEIQEKSQDSPGYLPGGIRGIKAEA